MLPEVVELDEVELLLPLVVELEVDEEELPVDVVDAELLVVVELGLTVVVKDDVELKVLPGLEEVELEVVLEPLDVVLKLEVVLVLVVLS